MYLVKTKVNYMTLKKKIETCYLMNVKTPLTTILFLSIMDLSFAFVVSHCRLITTSRDIGLLKFTSLKQFFVNVFHHKVSCLLVNLLKTILIIVMIALKTFLFSWIQSNTTNLEGKKILKWFQSEWSNLSHRFVYSIQICKSLERNCWTMNFPCYNMLTMYYVFNAWNYFLMFDGPSFFTLRGD